MWDLEIIKSNFRVRNFKLTKDVNENKDLEFLFRARFSQEKFWKENLILVPNVSIMSLVLVLNQL